MAKTVLVLVELGGDYYADLELPYDAPAEARAEFIILDGRFRFIDPDLPDRELIKAMAKAMRESKASFSFAACARAALEAMAEWGKGEKDEPSGV